MQIRRPSIGEKIIQFFMFIFVCVLAFDVFDASRANCEVAEKDKSGWCRIWGRTEEPFAWNYETQEIYVRSGLVVIALVAAGGLAPFFAPNAIVGVILLLGTPYVGSWALNQLGLFGP